MVELEGLALCCSSLYGRQFNFDVLVDANVKLMLGESVVELDQKVLYGRFRLLIKCQICPIENRREMVA